MSKAKNIATESVEKLPKVSTVVTTDKEGVADVSINNETTSMHDVGNTSAVVVALQGLMLELAEAKELPSYQDLFGMCFDRNDENANFISTMDDYGSSENVLAFMALVDPDEEIEEEILDEESEQLEVVLNLPEHVLHKANVVIEHVGTTIVGCYNKDELPVTHGYETAALVAKQIIK